MVTEEQTKGCESKGVVLLSVKGAVPLARRLVDHVNIHIPCTCLRIAYIGICAEGCTLWNLARAKHKRLLQCTKPKALMECHFWTYYDVMPEMTMM